MNAISVRELLARGAAGQSVLVRGWLRTARHSKGVSFLDVSDGSSLAGIQVVCEPALANYESEVRRLDTGCAVEVTGELVASQGKEQALELRAARLDVVGWVDADYPLQKKRHSFEFLRTIAHLRPRTNTLGAVLRVRNVAAQAVHRFFQERGFAWLHTPIITASDAEGAGAMFRVSAGDGPEEFFGRPTFLTVSGQLEAEIGALALGRVYTFGPTFRAENSNTSRHLAEFWMIEPEVAFCDLRGDMALAEEFLRFVLRAVLDEAAEDMAFFDQRIAPGVRATLEHVAGAEFAHLTYTEAIAALEGSGEPFEFPVKWGADLQSEHERWLTERHVGRPVIVTDYPKEIKAFYMYANDDGRTVRAMDVLVPKVGEIIGGSQREDRLDVLRARLRECGLDESHYGWYLDLRRYGSVPHAGFGLGFERLMLYVTGMANIRDVIPFPRVPGWAEF
ncbi:MAG TPA: asparagine--tRNA ligase [Myxococcota bacterium]|nr:asparagine--tRNA ligase [Myxococcota bacterium]